MVPSSVLLILALAAAADENPAPPASALALAETRFENPRVLVAMSNPPQFDVVFTREMPTPGFSFVVDAVDVEPGRIVARLTEVPPTGQTAQVITKADCRVPLGRLARGTYLLELWVRRGPSAPHALEHALVLRAR